MDSKDKHIAAEYDILLSLNTLSAHSKVVPLPWLPNVYSYLCICFKLVLVLNIRKTGR